LENHLSLSYFEGGLVPPLSLSLGELPQKAKVRVCSSDLHFKGCEVPVFELRFLCPAGSRTDQ